MITINCGGKTTEAQQIGIEEETTAEGLSRRRKITKWNYVDKTAGKLASATRVTQWQIEAGCTKKNTFSKRATPCRTENAVNV